MLKFWIRVKDELEYLGLSQKDLAKKIRESYNTLQSWINKDRLPNAEQAVKIANVLQTSVGFLVTGKHPNKRASYTHTKTIQLLEAALKNLKGTM